MSDTRAVIGHRHADHSDCECVEELDHELYDCDCPGYPQRPLITGNHPRQDGATFPLHD